MTAGAASAQSATDAQCIILSNAFANQSKDAEQQKAAQASMYFYLGRIGNQMTAAQLKTLLDAQAKAIDSKTAGEAMNKCVGAVEAKVQLMESLAGPPPAAKPAAPAQPHR
jgi:hypothetical protein